MMTQKQNIRILLIAGLIAASLGGWLLHVRIHPLSANDINWIPFLAGIVGVLIVPVLFMSKKLMPYGYIINGMLVIIGSITMAHASLNHLPDHSTLLTIFIGTLLADIVILFANFFIGKALFELEMFKAIDAVMRSGRLWRYPNMGWWGVHFLALSVVYILGCLLWK
jgi:hypothetical protein